MYLQAALKKEKAQQQRAQEAAALVTKKKRMSMQEQKESNERMFSMHAKYESNVQQKREAMLELKRKSGDLNSSHTAVS